MGSSQRCHIRDVMSIDFIQATCVRTFYLLFLFITMSLSPIEGPARRPPPPPESHIVTVQAHNWAPCSSVMRPRRRASWGLAGMWRQVAVLLFG